MNATTYRFDSVLSPDGWLAPGWVSVDAAGNLSAVTAAAPPNGAIDMAGHAVPGLPNLHSHAFQRAMAGLAERAGFRGDSFWTWREVMYRFLARIGPEELEAIAAQLFVEMLKSGYTSVCEFHYLHHAPDGAAYDDPAEMSRRLIAASRYAGIGMTLLPVLYSAGGFGGLPPGDGQHRFVHDAEGFVDLLKGLVRDVAGDAGLRLGMAPHSLRAVPPETLARALEGLDGIDRDAPVHIHIAEQRREVSECETWCGARPVEWLLASTPVDSRWCLVHATHMNAGETSAFAASGAVAGLCPTTEANLGDGLFPLRAFLDAGGALGVGSDSHISVNAVEELRWLEYGQRLAGLRRNVAASPGQSTGATLYRAALAGGAKASGRAVGSLTPGHRADIVVLDADHPSLAGRSGDEILDSWLFASAFTPVRDVMVGGQWRVRDGRHAGEDAIARAYRETVGRLG